jgi:hypothetical protein
MHKKYDVVVVGGGIAGICAAIAARRMDASVLLIEKNMSLGGVLTTSLVNPMMTFHSPMRQISKGIGQEIVNRLIEKKGAYGHIPDPIGFVETITPFNPDIMKTVLIEFLQKEKVDYLLGSMVSEVKIKSGKITEIVIITTHKKIVIEGSVFIDSTGDGNLCIQAGAPFIEGENDREKVQPMSLLFELSGVKKQQIIDYIKKHPDEFVLGENWDFKYLAVAGFYQHMKKIQDYGIQFKRDRLLFFEVPFAGDRVFMNTTRYNGYAGDPEELTKAQSLGVLDLWRFIDFLRREIPGFKEASFIQQGCSIGVRETTHVIGDYVISSQDLLERKQFRDKIAIGAYPIDLHVPHSEKMKTVKIPYPGEYEIPLRSLFPKKIKNVLLCGRNISADHLAFSAIRTSPLAASTGLAAGINASLSLKYENNVRDVDYKKIQKEILNQGGIL